MDLDLQLRRGEDKLKQQKNLKIQSMLLMPIIIFSTVSHTFHGLLDTC